VKEKVGNLKRFLALAVRQSNQSQMIKATFSLGHYGQHQGRHQDYRVVDPHWQPHNGAAPMLPILNVGLSDLSHASQVVPIGLSSPRRSDKTELNASLPTWQCGPGNETVRDPLEAASGRERKEHLGILQLSSNILLYTFASSGLLAQKALLQDLSM
jgi:hypothetical protein